MKAPPLSERIRRDIEARILSGELAPGARVPFEHELTERYGCARMTVSKALSALADAGLIERRKRAGSFVARPRSHAMILDIPDLEAEVRGRGEAYAFEPIRVDQRAPCNAAEREIAGQGLLLAIEGLHRADGRPLALEHRLIALGAVPEAAGIDLSLQSPGAWLLDHVPWTEAETRFDAVNADAEVARLLAVDEGTACLAIERRTWRGKDRITRVRQTFAPGARDLVARFGHRHATG